MSKKPDNVVRLPGIQRPDLDEPAPWHQVFEDASKQPIQDVVVVTRDVAGVIVVFSSLPNNDTTIGLLMRGVNALLDEDVAGDPEATPE